MAINSAQGITKTQVLIGYERSVGGASEEDQVRKPADAKETSAKETPKVEAAKRETQVKEAARQLNDFMERASIALSFSTESESGQIVVRVVSKQTGELIRQIPSEEALKISKALDTLQGLIIKATV